MSDLIHLEQASIDGAAAIISQLSSCEQRKATCEQIANGHLLVPMEHLVLDSGVTVFASLRVGESYTVHPHSIRVWNTVNDIRSVPGLVQSQFDGLRFQLFPERRYLFALPAERDFVLWCEQEFRKHTN